MPSRALALLGFVAALLPAELRADERPRGRYVHIDAPVEAFASDDDPQAGLGHLLFLNRCPDGITISYGDTDDSRRNRSMIVNRTIHLDPYPFGDESWNRIVADVREMLAPFDIVVTDIDPGDVPHDEAVVCGSDVDAGFAPAAGIAPWTCRRILNAMTFTFPDAIGDDTRYTSETVVQEAAHAWGLDHSFACKDPMTYLEGCGRKSFIDGARPCGEYEARECACGGDTQNTYRHVLGLFGPAQDHEEGREFDAVDSETSEGGDDEDLEVVALAKPIAADDRGCACRSSGRGGALVFLFVIAAVSTAAARRPRTR